MKKVLVSALFAGICFGLQAQNIVKGRWTVTGGILGSGNFGNFRTGGENPTGIKYNMQFGWSAGGWINFPAGKLISIEPQLLYTNQSYESENFPASNLLGTIGYISVPLLIKFHIAPKFALTVGPQVDFVMQAKDDNAIRGDEDFDHTSVAVAGGVELFPRGRVTVFGRYVYGFTDFNNPVNSQSTVSLYNQSIQVGVKLRLFGKYIQPDSDGDGIKDPDDKCPTQVGLERYQGCPIPDSDSDGVNDELDKCPNQAGLAQYNGCPVPDTDKDGINDELDKCPTVAGLPKYNGCPIPDTDKDNVNDEVDKCPTVAGLAKYNGCPAPDTDGDGINDDDDRCPTVPGVAAMKGCPQIETFKSNEVTFSSSKAVLTASGKKELDLVVDFLKKNPDVKVKIDGYTDATGNDNINQPLSVKRADRAKQYIISKGIDASRIVTEGHGSANPIADNKTPKGKAQNRRVEVTVQ